MVSFSWFLDGEELDTSWASAGEGVVVNQLKVAGVEQRHRDARVTCRLVTVDEGQADQLAANITDRTAVIAMFCECARVPGAALPLASGPASHSGRAVWCLAVTFSTIMNAHSKGSARLI